MLRSSETGSEGAILLRLGCTFITTSPYITPYIYPRTELEGGEFVL